MKTFKRILYAIGFIAVVGFAIGLYMFFKEPADVREQAADFRLSADELAQAFRNEEVANLQFNGKVIEVTGTVSSVEVSANNVVVYLETSDPLTGITCNFYLEEQKEVTAVVAGEVITIKGLCTGKLMDVVLTNSSIVKNNTN
jgi:hypothetical protein